jgi:two-component system chemotaxis sensor kinase CheA
MSFLTRSATIVLAKAVENKNSFRDLLDTTENYVAMIDSKNEVVYASKTLSRLGNIEEPELVQGRPLIDLFPGKSLKIQAGKLLKEKDAYADDWEFSLDGQKRFFKAVSHSLPGGSEGTLISLYDMTHLAERDEIAAMKDSMKIGLFFMNKDYIIQDHYSRYLEELLSESRLFGRAFTDIITDSVTPSELEAIKDYFKMVLEKTYDLDMLEDINPLTELHYAKNKKVFQCEFNTVERGHGELFILVTVYDITLRVELQQRLEEEEARRHEEMQSVFELIQVSPSVFNDFLKDTEHEFSTIDKVFKDEGFSAHEALVKIYQSVHAVKSNAVILGLNVFGNKVHNLESKIKKLREHQGEIPFNEMLNLTMDIEKLSKEKDGFKEIIKKIESYVGTNTVAAGDSSDQNVKTLIDSLTKTAAKGAEDLEKQIKFVAGEIDSEAVNNGPRRVIKEILMQLVRNSVVHGIEMPDDRKAAGKNETGVIKLSIAMSPDRKTINLRLTDDGKGLDYSSIAKKAIKNGIIKEEDADNKDILIKAIFSPGFSTAEVEGVHGGRGIGLNLVRDRIKEVDGNIKLKSELNKGTIFLVTIPLKQKDQPQ